MLFTLKTPSKVEINCTSAKTLLSLDSRILIFFLVIRLPFCHLKLSRALRCFPVNIFINISVCIPYSVPVWKFSNILSNFKIKRQNTRFI